MPRAMRADVLRRGPRLGPDVSRENAAPGFGVWPRAPCVPASDLAAWGPDAPFGRSEGRFGRGAPIRYEEARSAHGLLRGMRPA